MVIKEAAAFVMKQQESQVSGKESEKLLVHCRAGIGRTGTTLALINAMLHLDANGGDPSTPLSVFSIVRRLREQRIWMVQTENQYEYIY